MCCVLRGVCGVLLVVLLRAVCGELNAGRCVWCGACVTAATADRRKISDVNVVL